MNLIKRYRILCLALAVDQPINADGPMECDYILRELLDDKDQPIFTEYYNSESQALAAIEKLPTGLLLSFVIVTVYQKGGAK